MGTLPARTRRKRNRLVRAAKDYTIGWSGSRRGASARAWTVGKRTRALASSMRSTRTSAPRSWVGASSVRRLAARGGGRSGAAAGGRGGWGPWRGWWGDDPPFHKPVFVLTHHERPPLTLSDTTFTFVTDGIEAALRRAREAAGDRDIFIGGGAETINQYLAAGVLDELELHVVPVLLGGGARLFAGLGPDVELEVIRVIEAPGVTHIRYRILK